MEYKVFVSVMQEFELSKVQATLVDVQSLSKQLTDLAGQNWRVKQITTMPLSHSSGPELLKGFKGYAIETILFTMLLERE